MRVAIFLMLLFPFFATSSAYPAEKLINQSPAWQGKGKVNLFQPGARFALPDGRTGIIETVLPNGQFETNLGIILNSDGSLTTEPQSRAVIIEPDRPEENGTGVLTEPSLPAQDAENPQIGDIIPATPDTVVVETPQAEGVAPAVPETPLTISPDSTGAKIAEPQNMPKTSPDEPDKLLSLAELIPLTPVPDKNAKTPQKTDPKTLPEKNAQAVQPEKKPEKKETRQPEKKEEKQPARSPARAKPGEELRIPEQAIKTGNLDFLEGCWQGTRPEYYSKRTIRECFCFGANGKSGKRRVFDPIGHRNCIGATQATLSQNGTLSVTSQGAACDDGERWGQAEMVCRNSGQRTPCSWVFKDANNGRQSYTIPFVKVESCGR